MTAVAPLVRSTAALPESRTGSVSNGGGPAILRINNVGRTYATAAGEVEALTDVSFDIRRGEFLAVVGPSGCGKTTLLRLLAGLDQPTNGEIVGADHETSNALIFQGRSVFPWMTVADNITYGLKLRGVRRRQRADKAADLLRLIGIERFAHVYPHQLSEGMRQRVAIARALAVDPELLLMDEPFNALDEQTKLGLEVEVLQLWERTRKTIVFITHSIDEALVMADRVIVMSAQPGRIREIVPVPFARPRDVLSVRSDPQFVTVFRRIWDLLRADYGLGEPSAGQPQP